MLSFNLLQKPRSTALEWSTPPVILFVLVTRFDCICESIWISTDVNNPTTIQLIIFRNISILLLLITWYCIIIGMITAVGLSNLQYCDMRSYSNIVILGIALLIGLCFPSWVAEHKNDINTGKCSTSTYEGRQSRWY